MHLVAVTCRRTVPLLLAKCYCLKSKSVPVHSIKTFRGMRLYFDSFLTPEPDGGDWSTSRPSRLIPREGTPFPHLRVIKSLMLDGWDVGGNKKCTQNFNRKTVGMVLVRRLSRTSEDSINVFSKLV
jgi:hypothetical protein